MSDLVYESELWLERSRVAREAGLEFKELASRMSTVLGRNYFGSGCEEAAVLFDRLSGLLGNQYTEFKLISDNAVYLADGCESAVSEIGRSEGVNVSRFGTEPAR